MKLTILALALTSCGAQTYFANPVGEDLAVSRDPSGPSSRKLRGAVDTTEEDYDYEGADE